MNARIPIPDKIGLLKRFPDANEQRFRQRDHRETTAARNAGDPGMSPAKLGRCFENEANIAAGGVYHARIREARRRGGNGDLLLRGLTKR